MRPASSLRRAATRLAAALVAGCTALSTLAAPGGSPPGRLVIQSLPYVDVLATDPSGRLLASAFSREVAVYSLAARALVGRHPVPIVADRLRFVAGGRWLWAGSSGGSVLLDPGSGTQALAFGVGGAPGTEWRDVAFARHRAHGFGIRSVRGEPRLAPLAIEESGAAAATLVAGEGWPLERGCKQVATDDRGELAVVWCSNELRLFSRTGPLRALPRPDGPAPRDGAWVTSDGAWLATVVNARKGELAWTDLRSGRETRVALPRPSDGARRGLSVMGLFGAKSNLLAVVGGSIVQVQPTKGIVGQTRLDPQVTAAAYDELRGLYVFAAGGGLSLFEPDGQVVGRIGRDVRPMSSLLHDPATDRLYAPVPEPGLRMPLREIDLAAGELRAVPRDGEPPAVHVDVSSIGGELHLLDLRAGDAARLPLDGIAEGVLRWGTRASADRAVVASGDRLGLVDLAARRFERWLPRAAEPLPASAHLLPGGELLLLLPDGTLETWDLARGVLSGKQATSWKPEDAYAPQLRAVAQLPGGAVLFGAADGLFAAAAAGAVITPVWQGVFVERLAVSPAGTHVAVGLMGGTALCAVAGGGVDLPGCRPVAARHAVFLRGGAELAGLNETGGLSVFRIADGALLAQAFAGGVDAFLFLTPDQLYKASPNALDLAVFARGTQGRFLEEVDVRLNRPASVIEALGRASPERVAAYRAIEARRRERQGEGPALSGDGAAPRVELLEPPPAWTARESLAVRVRVEAGAYLPVRLVARVNGVPIGGRRGLSVPAAKTPAGGRFEHTLEIPVGPGENRVVVTAVDAAGNEAFGESFVVTGTGERRPGRLFFLGVGVSDYPDAARRLAYAAKDVGDVSAALRRFEGRRLQARLLVDRQATRANVLAARAFLEQARFEDLVVVYLAGHGLLGADATWRFATHDLDFSRPAAGGLTFADFEELLDGLSAGSKVVLVDACHAGGELGREWTELAARDGAEGGVRLRGLLPVEDGPAVAPSLDAGRLSDLFADLRRGTGATVIAAAAQAEFAFEARGVANGVFTHAVLQTMREGAGARPEGELWLEEFVRTVRDRVGSLTEGRQRPNVRDGNVGFRRPLLRSPEPRVVYRPAKPIDVLRIAASGDGKRLALLSERAVRIVSTSSGASLADAPLPGGKDGEGACHGSACSGAFGRDGRTFYLSSGDGVSALDLRTKRWRPLVAGGVRVTAAQLSPDGRYALAARADGTLVALRLGAKVEVAAPLPDDLGQCAWAPTGARLRCHRERKVPSWDGSDPGKPAAVVEWDPETRRARKLAVELEDPRGDVAWNRWFSPEGRFLLERVGSLEEMLGLATGGQLTAIDLATGRRIALGTSSAILLTDGRPVAAGVPRIAFPDETGSAVPVVDSTGAHRASVTLRGSASTGLSGGTLDAVSGGEILLRDDVIVASTAAGERPFSQEQLERRGTLFRLYDARTGEAAGWLGVPMKDVSIASGPGREILAVDRSTGQVLGVTLPE